jgi:hypothetical protein
MPCSMLGLEPSNLFRRPQDSMKYVAEPELDKGKLMVCMIISPIAAATVIGIVSWPGWWN